MRSPSNKIQNTVKIIPPHGPLSSYFGSTKLIIYVILDGLCSVVVFVDFHFYHCPVCQCKFEAIVSHRLA